MATTSSRKLSRLCGGLHLDVVARNHHRFSPYPPPTVIPPSSSSSSGVLVDLDPNEVEKVKVLGQGNGGTVYKVVRRRRNGNGNGNGNGDDSSSSSSSFYYALKKTHVTQEAAIHRLVSSFTTRVVPFLGSFHHDEDGAVSILMEYMAGGSLSEIGRLSESAVSDVARQVLQGFHALHSNNVVHRDVKPSNLLVVNGETKEVKIADFGVSKQLPSPLSRCDSYVGTTAYMSPERFDMQSNGGGYDGFAADVWSLGLVFLELYMGRYPLLEQGEKPDWPSLMFAVCFGEMPPPKLLPEEASEEFKDFISCCLQKDPAKRWTVAELINHPFLTTLSSTTTTTTTTTTDVRT